MTLHGDTEAGDLVAIDFGKNSFDGSRSVAQCTVIAPGDDQSVSAFASIANKTVVVRPDWIQNLSQLSGIAGAVCEEIDDFHGTKTKMHGERNTVANRLIVFDRIGLAGIEHDKSHAWQRRIPLAPKSVAVLASAIESCSGIHIKQLSIF